MRKPRCGAFTGNQRQEWAVLDSGGRGKWSDCMLHVYFDEKGGIRKFAAVNAKGSYAQDVYFAKIWHQVPKQTFTRPGT